MKSAKTRRAAFAAAALLFAAPVAACSDDDTDSAAGGNDPTIAYSTSTADSTGAETPKSSDAATHAGEAVNTQAQGEDDIRLSLGTVRAKAADGGDTGSDMTAIFGTLRNVSEKKQTIVGFTTSLGDDVTYEIHETVDGKMRQKTGGITLQPGGQDELAPGGDHLMIMDYADEIAAGSTIDLTLLLDDGREIKIPNVPVRSMGAGDEDYAGGEHGDHAEHPTEHAEHSH